MIKILPFPLETTNTVSYKNKNLASNRDEKGLAEDTITDAGEDAISHALNKQMTLATSMLEWQITDFVLEKSSAPNLLMKYYKKLFLYI